MAYKNKPYPIHFYGRVRGKCDGRLQNWPGIANERPKFLAMPCSFFRDPSPFKITWLRGWVFSHASSVALAVKKEDDYDVI